MKKYLSLCLSAALLAVLAGCGRCSRIQASLTGYDRVCVAGVSYLQFSSGVAVQVDLQGKPIGCQE